MAITHPLPDRIRQARLAKGYSQKQLGLCIGLDDSVASSRMNHYEKGRHIPDYELAKKIADELDVPVAYLFCESEEFAELLRKYNLLSESDRKEIRKLLDKLISKIGS